MNKKILTVILLTNIFLLLGCEKKEQKETTSQYKDLAVEKNDNIEKYYDESRLEKNKTYTFDEATKDFSFVLYTNRWENDQLEKDEFIFSYTDTENIELHTALGNEYEFSVAEENNINRQLTINIKEYKKENYKEKLKEEKYQIIKEENEYIFIKQEGNDNSYYGLKFYDNGTCLMAQTHDYSNDITEEEREINNIAKIKQVLETITLDKGYPFLQDKLSTIKNFDNKTIISAKYIGFIYVEEQKLYISKNQISLTVSYKKPLYSDDDNWKILKLENPYIVMNEFKKYKVVNKGLPEYYEFEDYRNNELEDQRMGGSLEDFNILINLFYE